jgi:hypothetical protein
MNENESAAKSTDPRLLRLAPEDNVFAATRPIESGEAILIDGCRVTIRDRIPTGHKLAAARIAVGEKVVKYGAPIGSATVEIRPGDYVHTHNLKSDYLPTRTLETPAVE